MTGHRIGVLGAEMGARRMHKCDGLYVGDEGDPLVGIREMHRPVAGTGDVVASGGIRDVEMAKYDPSRLNEKGVVPRGTSYRSERPLRRLRRRFPFIFAARGAGAPPRMVLITHFGMPELPTRTPTRRPSLHIGRASCPREPHGSCTPSPLPFEPLSLSF